MTNEYDKKIIVARQDYMRQIAANFLPHTLYGLTVEVGCSDGNFLRLLLQKHNIEEYVGIDINQDKINKCRLEFPNFKFVCGDALSYPVERASYFLSFQSLEHIGTMGGTEDIDLLKRLQKGTIVVFSVPNRPYKNLHKRWFELDGWLERYDSIINFETWVTIQHPIKQDCRSFLFYGAVRSA